MNKVDVVESARLRTDIPPFRPGDQVKVHVNIREGGRERVQVFEGVVIARRGGGLRESFTVRKMSFGVGVERTFPVHAPAIAKLEVVRHGKVRRAKLYYLRELTGKKAKIEERRTRIPTWTPELAESEAEPDVTEASVDADAEGTAADAEGTAAEASSVDDLQTSDEAEASPAVDEVADVAAPEADAGEAVGEQTAGDAPPAEVEGSEKSE